MSMCLHVKLVFKKLNKCRCLGEHVIQEQVLVLDAFSPKRWLLVHCLNEVTQFYK